MATRAFREEPQGVQGGARGLPGRRPPRRHRTRPAGARHDVDADPAADDQHDGGARPPPRPGPQLHGAGAERPADRMDEPPYVVPRLAARGRHVGRRGPDAPLPDQGPRRADPDVPAVLRPLHADGSGRQRHVADPQVQVRGQAERPMGADARLPPAHAAGPRRGRVRRRHGERADQAARGLRVEAPGHREHPRHPYRVEGPDGAAAALPAGRRPSRAGGHGDEGSLTRRRHRAPHPRQLRAAGDAAGRTSRAGDARGGLPRRAQPRCAAAGREHRAERSAGALLHAPRPREDHAVLLLHVRHDPERRALADVGRRGAGPAVPPPRVHARVRHAARRLRRAVRRQALGASC